MRNQVLEYCAVDILEENMFLEPKFDNGIIGVCFTMNEGFTPAYDLDIVKNEIIRINKITEETAIVEINKLIENYPEISFIKYLNDSWDELSKYNKEMLFLNDYNSECLVGVRFKQDTNIISVYDDYLCVQSLMENDDMDEEMAIEYFEYNTRGSYVGENTPAFLTLL
jgi:hypothetical protein